MRKLALTAIVLFVLAGQTAQAAGSLEYQARQTALHGGIQGSRWGAATPKMKWLARQLIKKVFAPAGSVAVQRALCIIHREAGENPGAVNSSSGAAGLFQFLGHPQYDSWKLTHDPVYQVKAAWQMSHHGTHWSDWDPGGQTYYC